MNTDWQKAPASEVISVSWVCQVHVNKVGFFSDCEEWCNKCAWYDVWDVQTVPDLNQVKKLSSKFKVSSHSSKTYTYYEVTTAAINYLLTNHNDKIETIRWRLIEEDKIRRETVA